MVARVFGTLCLLSIFLSLAACASSASKETVRADGCPDNFGVVDASKLYRGGQPNSEEHWNCLRSMYGVKTVLKLNRYAEDDDTVSMESEAATRHGIRLVQVLMQPEDFPHNWNPFAAPTDVQVNEALATLTDASSGPVYVHCSHGSDRTGLVVALYQMRVENYCRDRAIVDMKAYHHSPFLLGINHYLDREKEPANCVRGPIKN
jgi:protein tyrosine/serine phosphatase